jgi:hypothetical protein
MAADANATTSDITLTAVSLSQSTGLALVAAVVNATAAGAPPPRASLLLLRLSPLDAGSLLLAGIAISTVVGGALWSGRDYLARKSPAGSGRNGSGPSHGNSVTGATL